MLAGRIEEDPGTEKKAQTAPLSTVTGFEARISRSIYCRGYQMNAEARVERVERQNVQTESPVEVFGVRLYSLTSI